MIRSDVIVSVLVGAMDPRAYAGLFTGSGTTAPVLVMSTSNKWSAL